MHCYLLLSCSKCCYESSSFTFSEVASDHTLVFCRDSFLKFPIVLSDNHCDVSLFVLVYRLIEMRLVSMGNILDSAIFLPSNSTDIHLLKIPFLGTPGVCLSLAQPPLRWLSRHWLHCHIVGRNDSDVYTFGIILAVGNKPSCCCCWSANSFQLRITFIFAFDVVSTYHHLSTLTGSKALSCFSYRFQVSIFPYDFNHWEA